MKKWKLVDSKYSDISVVKKFHRHTMHLKSNIAIQGMKKIDYEQFRKAKNNEKIRLCNIEESDIEDIGLFKILERRRTSWFFEKDMGEKELSIILQKSFGVTLSTYYNEFLVHLRAYASAGAMYEVKPIFL